MLSGILSEKVPVLAGESLDSVRNWMPLVWLEGKKAALADLLVRLGEREVSGNPFL